ncbi:Transforming growth factor-beta induced protein IG-H3 precursor-like protein [Anopheles sinensis]|uniref:Transforming growth factor-beta induced protein IG-H3-like protein n=1 Tax=Anopheles sinensis TaxID=74873 RepID=A0A084W749_ANOSI|nr:Transforming growth factor-beta induced protein IG-H3 precursor-like protein [Anopheles sinensis]
MAACPDSTRLNRHRSEALMKTSGVVKCTETSFSPPGYPALHTLSSVERLRAISAPSSKGLHLKGCCLLDECRRGSREARKRSNWNVPSEPRADKRPPGPVGWAHNTIKKM